MKIQGLQLKGLKFKLTTYRLTLTAYLLFSLWVINFMGCVSVPLTQPPIPSAAAGIYHRVEKGQTLWRISRVYNVDLEELARINHISDAANIEAGELVFIPHTQKRTTVFNKSYCEDFIWPLKGKVIAKFGENFHSMINRGINIQPYRDLDVVASRSGRVVFYSDNFKGFGKTIIIDHADGFLTVYARNREVFIKVGDTVQKGTVIAKVGSYGQDKNVYLHFQIRKGHISQNPYFYLSS